MRTDPDLWSRLQGLEVGAADAPLSFRRRLARENGWTDAFATRAFEEYRRYLYLCAVAERPLTPSRAVDRVWHLHLTYSRSYWDDLCGERLGRALHHEPSTGAAADAKRFREAYARTLALYAKEFGPPPPPGDIWPDVAARFAPGAFRWVDTSRHWPVRKTSLAVAGGALALASTPLGTVVAANGLPEPFGSMPQEELLAWGALCLGVVLTLWRYVRRRGRRDDRSSCGSDCGCGE